MIKNKWLILTVLILILIFFIWRNLGFRNKILNAKAEIDRLNEKINQFEAEATKLKDENEKYIKEIKTLKRKAGELSLEVLRERERAIKLENERPPVREECEELYKHMLKEIEAWKNQFTLAIYERDVWRNISQKQEEIIENKNKEIKIKEEEIKLYAEKVKTQHELIIKLEGKLAKKDKIIVATGAALACVVLFSLISK